MPNGICKHIQCTYIVKANKYENEENIWKIDKMCDVNKSIVNFIDCDPFSSVLMPLIDFV